MNPSTRTRGGKRRPSPQTVVSTACIPPGDTADSASSDFFLCVGPQPSLDFGGTRATDRQGFAAFGRVTSGMDVVRRIQAGQTNNREQLLAPVTIARVYRK